MNNPMNIRFRRHPYTLSDDLIARRHTMTPDVALDEFQYLLLAHTWSLNVFENVRKWCKRR
jgi:hypothetical protein